MTRKRYPHRQAERAARALRQRTTRSTRIDAFTSTVIGFAALVAVLVILFVVTSYAQIVLVQEVPR